MWQDREDFKKPQSDSPMKEMVRHLFQSEPEAEQAEPKLKIRQANIRPVQQLTRPPVLIRPATSPQFSEPAEDTAGPKVKSNSPKLPEEKSKRPEVATKLPPAPCQDSQRKEVPPPLKIREIQESRKIVRELGLKNPARSKHTKRFQSLTEAVKYSRTRMPLPREIQLRQRPEHRTWLIARLQACHSEADLRRFAYSLRTKDLDILFPSLASLKKGEEIEKLLSVILYRASKYLYVQGWVTLQYAYPRSTVQKGLAMLCEVLEEKAPNTQSLSDLSPYQGLDLGADRFDWQSVHLISEISLPNTRHFLSSLIKYLRDTEMEGENFFQRYGIYRNLALGQAIISQWEMAVFESNLHSHNPLRSLFGDGDQA